MGWDMCWHFAGGKETWIGLHVAGKVWLNGSSIVQWNEICSHELWMEAGSWAYNVAIYRKHRWLLRWVQKKSLSVAPSICQSKFWSRASQKVAKSPQKCVGKWTCPYEEWCSNSISHTIGRLSTCLGASPSLAYDGSWSGQFTTTQISKFFLVDEFLCGYGPCLLSTLTLYGTLRLIHVGIWLLGALVF
jgi:hypothetical protein